MNVKPTLHAWDKCHLVMTYWHFYILLHSICECFLKDFASLFVRDVGLSFFFFLIVSLSHSGFSVTLTNENCWEVSLTLWKNLCKIGVTSSLDVWDSPVQSCGLPSCLCRKVLNYKCHLLDGYRAFPASYFFLCKVWSFVSFNKSVHFIYLVCPFSISMIIFCLTDLFPFPSFYFLRE